MRCCLRHGWMVVLLVLGTGCSSDDAASGDTGAVGGGGQGAGGATGGGGTSGTGGARDAGAGGATSAGGTVNTGGTTTNTGGTRDAGAGGTTNTGGTTVSDAAPPSPCTNGPALTPGTWKDITPPAFDASKGFGANDIEIDPTDTCVIYGCFDQQGIFKSTDAGATWTKLGVDPGSPNYGTTAAYIDSPIRVAIDPSDSRHLYATQGVRGSTLGFWESTDGGATWTMPQSFSDLAASTTTRDVTTLAIFPTDFKHILLGSHSSWKGLPNAGLLESKDGGKTWITHAPAAGWASSSVGIAFLYDGTSTTDDKTWMVSGDGGFWRTTDAGTAWTSVSSNGGTHGGAEFFRAKTGVLYAGAFVYPQRSTDNGVTWTQLGGLPYAAYYDVVGDGTTLYTNPSFATNGAYQNKPYYVSPESDGTTWTQYKGGAQTVPNGPYRMRFDKVNRIMYTANWDSGLWALKVE